MTTVAAFVRAEAMRIHGLGDKEYLPMARDSFR